MTDFSRVNILGVGVSAVNMDQVVAAMGEWIARRQKTYICLAPAHAIMGCVDDVDLCRVYNRSGLTVPDGMPIAWLLRWRGYSHVERVYGPDLMMAVCKRSVKEGWRHYFYGGAEGVTERLIQKLLLACPGLQIAGWETPPFRVASSQERQRTIERVHAARADILWIGIGSPRQELWMAQHVRMLDVPVMVGVGAAFDFLSGCKPQAPRWMQRSGLEWLFRLCSEPRRLWRRYLLGYPRFVALLFFQWTRLKRYPIED